MIYCLIYNKEVLMKTIGFLPLRGGSVSIPLKNIKLLNGRPLAYYALDALEQCEDINEIIVATDSIQIEQVIKQYPSSKITVVGRSPEVSTNISPTIEVMLEVLQHIDFDRVVLVQATSPLLKFTDLNKGLQMMKSFDSVVSIVRQHRFIWDEHTHLPNYQIPNKPRRQDWGGILVENGAFYITCKENLFKDRFYLSGNIGLCEMSANTYVEIDEESDWLFVEHLLQK